MSNSSAINTPNHLKSFESFKFTEYELPHTKHLLVFQSPPKKLKLMERSTPPYPPLFILFSRKSKLGNHKCWKFSWKLFLVLPVNDESRVIKRCGNLATKETDLTDPGRGRRYFLLRRKTFFPSRNFAGHDWNGIRFASRLPSSMKNNTAIDLRNLAIHNRLCRAQ